MNRSLHIMDNTLLTGNAVLNGLQGQVIVVIVGM
jgi:hypothetical protein